MKCCVPYGHSARVLLLVCTALLSLLQAQDPKVAPAAAEKIRVGVITQQDGPHLGIYFPAIANCSSVNR
jgi:hypothetical protein